MSGEGKAGHKTTLLESENGLNRYARYCLNSRLVGSPLNRFLDVGVDEKRVNFRGDILREQER